MGRRRKRLPAVAAPIAEEQSPKALSPWPSVEKYPYIAGQSLSLAVISNIFRLSLSGHRAQYVDLLDEMLEKDPHAYAVLSKRILAVATSKIVVTPSKKAKGKREERRAQEIATAFEAAFEAIPNLRQHLASLLWSVYYGPTGAEIHWCREGALWVPERLSFIHSRRLAYPVPRSWDLYLYDHAGNDVQQKGAGTWGLRIADFPGKFIIHSPQVRGDYPTREGLGRQLAYWMALKLIAARNAPMYLERFTKPWPHAAYNTKESGQTEPRPATTEDIEQAQAALDAMGGGNLKSWVHADSIVPEFLNPDGSGGKPKVTYTQWADFVNAEVSKAVSGGTLGTEVTEGGGSRAVADTQRKDGLALPQYDGSVLCETLRRDLATTFVRLNFKDALHLIPDISCRLEEDPDPMVYLERGAKAASFGMPVDADELAKQAGIPLIDESKKKPGRRLVPFTAVDPTTVDEDIARRAHEISELYGTATEEAAAEGESEEGMEKPGGSGSESAAESDEDVSVHDSEDEGDE